MNIRIKTKVNKSYEEVFQRFDIHLFMKLKPPLIGFNVKRFDGCKKGDELHIELKILGLKQNWISMITESGKNESEIYFTDKGTILPKPIKYWEHRHIIQKFIDSSIIIDDICYRTNSKILDYLLFLLIFIQFYYRKPVYKLYFRR